MKTEDRMRSKWHLIGVMKEEEKIVEQNPTERNSKDIVQAEGKSEKESLRWKKE